MTLEERLRDALKAHGTIDKRMFGGTCFMVNGNMVIGTLKGGLIVRVGKEQHKVAVSRPGARTFDMTGRAMEGFIIIDGEAVAGDGALRDWIDLAMAFNATLPAKDAKKPKGKRAP
jgi:TfoX/Sxy family transcriptional regulator of competence genes